LPVDSIAITFHTKVETNDLECLETIHLHYDYKEYKAVGEKQNNTKYEKYLRRKKEKCGRCES
jgi:hypothetical protein